MGVSAELGALPGTGVAGELLPRRGTAWTGAKSQDMARWPWQWRPHLVGAIVMTAVFPDSGTGPSPFPLFVPQSAYVMTPDT